MKTELKESTPLVREGLQQPAGEAGGGRIRVSLITPGWGSSGYYSADVLEAAATDRVFPAGTHMYMNHPSATEAYDRPERDVKDLAAVLLEDAVWTPGQALEADAMVFSNWRAPLAEMAPYIGVSIRGAAEVEEGEAEGRRGRIMTKLVEGSSVDFVTKAGRGGSFEVLESAWSQGHTGDVSEAMSHDVRDALNTLVNDAYRVKGEDSSVYTWVRDYDADTSTVYFELEGAESGIFAQGYTTGDGGIPNALSGDRTEVRVETSYVPVDPTGQSTTTQESEEDTMPQIEEARLRTLEADAGRVPTLENERDTAVQRAEEAERQLAEARKSANAAIAQRVVAEAFDAHDVDAPKTAARLAANAPLTESGEVDTEALKTIAEESAAELAEASGAGTPRGISGDPGKDNDSDISEADLDRELAKLTGREIKEG